MVEQMQERLSVAAAFCLGAILLFAASMKAAEFIDFVANLSPILHYSWAAYFTACFVIALELTLGVMLCWDTTARVALGCTRWLLWAFLWFTIVVGIRDWYTGLESSCACFGRFSPASFLGRVTVEMVMLAVATFCLRSRRFRPPAA